jgi:cytochrome c-type biogenesis protein CcmH/NrfF
MKTRHRIAYLLIAGILVVPGWAGAQKDISREYKETCERLVCQCGCEDQLSVCAMQNCGSATPMRAEIRERLQKGESVEAIVQTFVDRVGPKVLSAPTMKGFDLTAWLMPFVMLCLGAVVVSWVLVKMVRPSRNAETVPPAALDARVDRELRDFEEES